MIQYKIIEREVADGEIKYFLLKRQGALYERVAVYNTWDEAMQNVPAKYRYDPAELRYVSCDT